jgi:transposase
MYIPDILCYTAIIYLTFRHFYSTIIPKGESHMIKIQDNNYFIVGTHGKLPIHDNDEITKRLFMLFEGECTGLGKTKVCKKYGLSRQRYYQLLTQFKQAGAEALKLKKTGPKSNFVRTGEIVRQIIRHRFLDPDVSAKVIAQKINQTGQWVSIRSVERVITDYGLQKKTLFISSKK